MLRQCAWCRMLLGEAKPVAEAPISHGICLSCADEFLSSLAWAEEGRERKQQEPAAAPLCYAWLD
jgi:hypothetical protein